MSSTTLVTFLVQTPRFARRVDLFGSWDNFSKAYSMERDQRMGSRQWRGCHSFTDIICDGDAPHVSDRRRDGGLMMGGIYWYYYQLNGDVEFYNPVEPCTTACPYLPGQEVNILEVPMQINVLDESSQQRSSSSTSSTEFTLNPNDKYQTPRPPEENLFVRRSGSTLYIRESTAIHATAVRITTSKDEARFERTRVSTDCPFSSLWNAAYLQRSDLFPIRSEPCTRPQSRWGITSGGRKLDAVGAEYPSDQRQNSQSDTAKYLKLPFSCEPGVAMSSNFAPNTFTHSSVLDADNVTTLKESRNEHPTMFDTKNYGTTGSCRLPSVQLSMSGASELVASVSSNQVMDASELCTQLNELQFDYLDSTLDDDPETAEIVLSQPANVIPAAAFVSTPFLNAGHTEAANDTNSSHSPTSLGRTFDGFNQKPNRNPSSISSSYVQGHLFSPALSSAALSQPDTPTMSDFEEDIYGLHYTAKSSHDLRGALTQNDPASRMQTKPQGFGGFDRYNLPKAHHASALTSKSIPATHATSSSSESAYDQKSGKELVESWNDGAEHRNSTTEDFFDDLGYLGGMIV